MNDVLWPAEPRPLLDRTGYQVEVEDDFADPELNPKLWIPYYLPQWSSRQAAAARYVIRDGQLVLRIEAEQQPWNQDVDGWLRVSSLQTGVFSGPLGSALGQHRFDERLVVREEQDRSALYTPLYGLFEIRARAIADSNNMCACWMIGFDDEPGRSAEICLFELFGSAIGPDRSEVRMGLHPFGDPSVTDEFSTEILAMDATALHTYAAEWTPSYVAFYVDDRLIKVSRQSPAYPMQFMLNIYEFADGEALEPADAYPKEFVVDFFRGYRRA
jgi:hypothetical protein